MGGTGFIGQRLVKRCQLAKLNITIISKTKKKNKHKSIRQIHCDILKKNLLYKALNNKNFDYVVNLAGYVDHSKKINTLKTHYNGCKNLADYFKNQKLKKFIQIGSSVEYGKIKAPQIESKKIKEGSQKSFYGLAKLKSTKYLLGLNKKNAFPCTILRFFLVYGPGQSENRIIPFVIKNCLRKKTFNSSSGNQVRDFLYIDDAIESIMKCLKNKESNGQIINVCSSSPVKIKFVINKIWKIIKKGKPVFGKIRLRPDEPTKLFSNYLKANKILNWKPTINLNQGIKKTIKYYE